MVAFQGAWRQAAENGEPEVESEALRHLAVIYHHRNRHLDSTEMARRSHEAAVAARSPALEAEALNALAGLHIDRGELADARRVLALAGEPAARFPSTAGKVAQNLGIVASMQGHYDEASGHYDQALMAFAAAGDDRGRAVVYINLGLVCVERHQWTEADDYFGQSLALAVGVNDLRLQGLGHLSRADALFGQGHHDLAREEVDLARSFFHRIGSLVEEADAYRLAGRIYRASGRYPIAEILFKTAIELARRSSSVLCEADVLVDLAELSGEANRPDDRRNHLLRAKSLYARLSASIRVAKVDAFLAAA